VLVAGRAEASNDVRVDEGERIEEDARGEAIVDMVAA
jgi:hypothetical protein